jgi:hypothetical protein
MLAITTALLGGASYLALSSINNAAAMVDGSAQQQSRDIGVLLSVVGAQSNGTGTYVWIFNSGWESAPINSVFLNAQRVTWSTTCAGDWSGSMCVVTLSKAAGGIVTVVVGGKSLEVSV